MGKVMSGKVTGPVRLILGQRGDAHLQNELEGIFLQWPSAKEEGRNLPISKGYISNHRIENELVLLFIAR